MTETPRFFNHDTTLSIASPSGVYGYCFADTSADGAYETHHWVLSARMQAPPTSTDQLAQPADPARRYLSISEWRNALFQPTSPPLWPGGDELYLKTHCKLFPAITSVQPADYAIPFPDPVPSESVSAQEIDPGEVFMFDPVTGVQTGAAVREAGPATHWREFWVLTDAYTPPGPNAAQSLGAYPQGKERPASGTYRAFLEFYKPLWEPGYQLVSVAVCQYTGYFPAP